VARMVMQGLLYTNDIPFETIYLHGLVRDDQGRKMSKTTGNVLDPIALLDGAKPDELSDYIRQQYPDGLQPMGADALRFTLLTGSTPGSDMNLSLQRVEGNRNFTNKIWNAVRFVLTQLTIDDRPSTMGPSPSSMVHGPSSLAERWILSRLSATIADATRLMDTFQYGEVGRQIYDFFWSEFCDWYLEISKIALYRGDATAKAETRATLVKVLDESLRLLHPFIPFVTEETWGYLKAAEELGSRGAEEQRGRGAGWPEALIVAPWPQAGARDLAAEADMGLVMDLVRAIRNARAEYDVKPGAQIAASIAAGSREALLNGQAEVLCALARLDPARLSIAARLDAPAKALTLVVGSVTAYLPLADLVDLAAERAKLNKELTETEAQIDRSRSLLDGPFAQRAPANVVQREREKLGELVARAERLCERLAELE
jgi:valyl-tRNA synthetase